MKRVLVRPSRFFLSRSEKSDIQKKTKEKAVVAQGTETIMVVEDEPDILDIVSLMLTQLGYHVISSSSVEQAVKLASEGQEKIDLLLTDVIMPGMNGRELGKRIAEIFPDIKHLFMSGYTADIIGQHGVLDEGIHFLAKPFSKEDLADKVRDVLG